MQIKNMISFSTYRTSCASQSLEFSLCFRFASTVIAKSAESGYKINALKVGATGGRPTMEPLSDP